MVKLNGIESKTDVTESHFGTSYSSVVKDKSIEYTNASNTVLYSYTTTGTDDIEKINTSSVKYNGSTSLSSSYFYDDNGNVLTKSYGENTTVTNTYDSKDRITSTTYAGKTTNYTYDSNGQLVSANDDTYTYDIRGNITSKTESGTTTTFSYSNSSWKDELTAVNGTPLTYDENGNVLTYGNKKFTWNTGRNLESIVDGNNKYSYTYDETGIRTSKIINGKTTYYNTKDGVILSQTDGTNTMYFQYDTNGFPLGFIYNGVQYFYLTNQMGDVISITDAQGNELVQYEYDEWGKCVVTLPIKDDASVVKLAELNPIRYRGYYYDNETGYYYLQSRYYDPDICRFINADSPEYLILQKDFQKITNSFVYCLNDPINYMDLFGYYRTYIYDNRDTIYSAAELYLDKKGYNLTKKLFYHFLYGNGKCINKSTESLLISKLKSAAVLNNEIKRYLRGVYASKMVIKNKSIQFTSGDLHYAIQKMGFCFSATRISGNWKSSTWKVCVTAWDVFDFDQIRTFSKGIKVTISNVANDLGYWLQKLGIGKEYSWAVSYNVQLKL